MEPDLTWQEAVERLAYQIYEAEGRPEGKSVEHWLEAERQLGDRCFLHHELEVEEEEGGLVPKE